MRVSLLIFFVLTSFPAWAGPPPHSGIVRNDGFQLSDVALAVFAALGIWFARRALRARFRRRHNREKPTGRH